MWTRLDARVAEPLVREGQHLAPVLEVPVVVRDDLLHVDGVLPVRQRDARVRQAELRRESEKPRHTTMVRTDLLLDKKRQKSTQ